MLKIKNLQLKRVEGSIVEFSIEISNHNITRRIFLKTLFLIYSITLKLNE